VENPEKKERISVAKFFRSIENFDESAIYAIDITNKFRKSVKRCYSRNLDLGLLEKIIYTLAQGKSLDARFFPHPLKGFSLRPNEKVMECHMGMGKSTRPKWSFY